MVGGAPVLTNYSVPLTGAYTTEDEGLEIVADDAEYGPQATGAAGVTRQFTIDNLTAKPLSLAIALPRQFVLSGAPCAGLAPNASCNFSVSFLPLDNGDLTGTLFATGTPTGRLGHAGRAQLCRGIRPGRGNAFGDGRAAAGRDSQLRPGGIRTVGAEDSDAHERIDHCDAHHPAHHQRVAIPFDHDLRHNACARRILHGHAGVHAD